MKFSSTAWKEARRLQALALRQKGWKQIQIAEALGVAALQIGLASAEFERGTFFCNAQTQDCLTHIFDCLEWDAPGLATALALKHEVRAHPVEIIVSLSEQQGLAQLLPDHPAQVNSSAHRHIFPLYDQTCQPDWVLRSSSKLVARAPHEYWRLQQAADCREGLLESYMYNRIPVELFSFLLIGKVRNRAIGMFHSLNFPETVRTASQSKP